MGYNHKSINDPNGLIKSKDPNKIGRSLDEFKVGQILEFSHTFTQKETEMMGDLIGDHNPFHYDGPFVKATRFQRPIVHGMLLAGMICHFGGDLFPGPGYLAERMDFDFHLPVYFGDTIRAVGTIKAIEIAHKRVTLHMKCYNTENQCVMSGNVTGIPFQVDKPSSNE